MKNLITATLLAIFCGLILTLTIRGIPGNPNDSTLNENYWTENGPLELSPERGKFALTYSLVEDNSTHFSVPVARFATPDLGYHNNKFVSLFPPGISFLTIPGYITGKWLGASQVGTYAIISLFAILNVFLIRAILKKLELNDLVATLSSLSFLFATTAYSYAVSLYQHHVSTFIILASLYVLIKFKNIWSLSLIWFLLALSLTIDSPNFFLTFPIGVYALGRIIYLKSKDSVLKIGVNLFGGVTIIAAIIPLLAFLWFNQVSYGDPFQLSGTIASVKALDEQGKPTTPEDAGTQDLSVFTDPSKQNKSAVNFFQTRNLLNGFYIHMFSPDRGLVFYAPVILLGFIGVFYFYKKNGSLCALFVALIGTNILLYSMWGDPWGGWAFGSRYLIPTYAMLSIFLGFALTQLNKNLFFSLIFFILFCYSVSVNTVGAITSSRNPPQVEVLGLEKLSGIPQKYTYDRNFEMLNQNKSKSFFFNSFANKFLTAWEYYFLLVLLVTVPALYLLLGNWLLNGRKAHV